MTKIRVKDVVIVNDEGLLMMEAGEKKSCLGFLMDFKEHGVFEPTLGKVDVTPEAAVRHNELLSQMMIDGLDNQCEVGQGSYFYTGKRTPEGTVIVTFIGTPVGVAQGRTALVMERNGRIFTGRRHKDDCIFMKRVK